MIELSKAEYLKLKRLSIGGNLFQRIVQLDSMHCVFNCSLVAGYYSARLYKTMKGVQWKKAALLVRFLFYLV